MLLLAHLNQFLLCDKEVHVQVTVLVLLTPHRFPFHVVDGFTGMVVKQTVFPIFHPHQQEVDFRLGKG
ncbi:hypothetical protein D3C81_925190 [compost metagenome]